MFLSRSSVSAFILGILVCLFAFLAWQFYVLRSVTLQNQAAIQQIVQFISSQQNKAPVPPGK